MLVSMNKKFRILIIVILILVAIRAVLPYGMLRGINWYLGNKVENYHGSIADFDLAIWRGSYSMQGLKIFQKNKHPSVPAMLSAEDLDISIAWRALIKGRLLIDLAANQLTLNLSDNKEANKKQLSGDKNGAKNIYETLIPFRIEKISLRNSQVVFANTSIKAISKFELSQINAEIENIHNNFDVKQILPSSLTGQARLQNSGDLSIKGRFNILAPDLAFDGDAVIEKFDLTELNDILLAYGPVSFTSGTLFVYAEMATREGQLKAYVKPFVSDIDVVAPKESFKSFKHFGLEMVTAASNLILRSAKGKTVATRLEFKGPIKDPEFSVMDSVWKAIENSFIEALEPEIDGSIQIENI